MSARRRSRPAAAAAPVLPPRWVSPVALALSGIGLGVSAYLTADHYAGITPYCTATGLVNCEKVTTSAQSVVFGIFPVPVLGLAFFVGMLVLQSPAAWRSQLPLVRWGRLASVVVGIGFVCYLIYTELFVLDAVCLWCTGVHAITLVLFAITVVGWALAAPAPSPAESRPRPRAAGRAG